MATIKDLLGKMIERINNIPKKLSDLEIDMELGGKQVQVDYNQNDETAIDYIKNKPEIPTDEEVLRMLAEAELINIVTDENGDIFTDLNGNIITF